MTQTNAAGSSGTIATPGTPAPRHGIAYSETGSGPTLVLIHGVCHSRHAWDDVVPYLADDFRVITIDLPGHGESPDPDPMDEGVVDRIIGDIANFLRDVTPGPGDAAAGPGDAAAGPDAAPSLVGKPHVAGNSLGGYVALELARRGHAASATALNPAGFFHGPGDQKRTVNQFLALRGTGRAFRKMIPFLSRTAAGRTFMFGMFSSKPWRLNPDNVIRDAGNLLRNKVIDHGLRAKFDFSPDTAGARQTCYWGTRDLTLYRGWKRHFAVLPDVPLHLLPNLGHVPMLDDPRTVAEAIRRGTGLG